MTTRAEIMARLAAATPGGWGVTDECEDWQHPDGALVIAHDVENDILIQIAGAYQRSSQDPHAPLPRHAHANAALIAHAPADLAWYDAELTKAVARVERLEAALRKIELNGTVYDNMKEMRDAARKALEGKP